MTVESQVVRIETQKEGEILDTTDQVQAIVENGTIKNGVVFLFVPDQRPRRLNTAISQERDNLVLTNWMISGQYFLSVLTIPPPIGSSFS